MVTHETPLETLPRQVGGITYTLIYDAESRLVQIKRGSNIQATYTYDGDNNRVKTVVGSTTTTYVGNYLEWSGSTTTMKKYRCNGKSRGNSLTRQRCLPTAVTCRASAWRPGQKADKGPKGAV